MGNWTQVAPSGTRPAGSGPGLTATTPAGLSYVGGGVPWVDENAVPDNHCTANKASGDRCTAYKTKDSEWCAGHLRKYGVTAEAGE